MRVLVTGGAGFIGSHVVAALAAAGHESVVLDALLPSAHPGGTPPELPGDRVVVGDVRDREAVADALAGVDAVCHQAAMVGLGKEFADAPLYVGCNDLGTAVLLAEMAAPGSGTWCLPGRWWSTARVATHAPGTARSAPDRVRRPICGRGTSSRAARSAERN